MSLLIAYVQRLINDVTKKRIMLSESEYHGVRCKDRLGKYNIYIDNEPTHLMAKVLKTPTVKFQGRIAECGDGSFNLKGMKFSRYDTFRCRHGDLTLFCHGSNSPTATTSLLKDLPN